MLMAKTATMFPVASLRPAGRNAMNTWQSVQDEVLRRIRTGEWRAGDLIPTENQLAAELGCARATVNRALSQLAQDGIVQRRRRVGTRVAQGNAAAAGAEAELIRTEVEATGAAYGYRLTRQSVVAAPPRIASVMHVPTGTGMIRYHALITADDAPYCIEMGYLSTDRPAGFTEDVIRDAEPLAWMRENVIALCGRLEITATLLSDECAEDLGAEKGLPVLTLDRTLWSEGTPLTHTRRVYPPSHRVSFAR